MYLQRGVVGSPAGRVPCQEDGGVGSAGRVPCQEDGGVGSPAGRVPCQEDGVVGSPAGRVPCQEDGGVGSPAGRVTCQEDGGVGSPAGRVPCQEDGGVLPLMSRGRAQPGSSIVTSNNLQVSGVLGDICHAPNNSLKPFVGLTALHSGGLTGSSGL